MICAAESRERYADAIDYRTYAEDEREEADEDHTLMLPRRLMPWICLARKMFTFQHALRRALSALCCPPCLSLYYAALPMPPFLRAAPDAC